jgi:hypothetical protein
MGGRCVVGIADSSVWVYATTSASAIPWLVAQREAAAFLGVSQSYLRASSCPKVLLPGNGLKDRPLVRYRLSEVASWTEQWTQRATVPQRRAC